MEHLVSEGLKEGHKRIESAAKAQRRSHGSLESLHNRASAASSVRGCWSLPVQLQRIRWSPFEVPCSSMSSLTLLVSSPCLQHGYSIQ